MSTETINQQAIPTGTWLVDLVHSSANFAVKHNGVTTFRSGFDRFEARLSGGEQARLEGAVEVDSIRIDEEMLKGHLLSPEFFDVQRFPQLRFASEEFSVGEDGSLRVRGELGIRGEKRQVEASGRFAQLGEDAYDKARVGLSINHARLRAAAGRLPAGAEMVEFDRLREIPPYDADLEAEVTPAAVAELRRAIREADAVLVATPEYNHSIPGVLKNALDWASRPAGQSALTGKPAAVIGASTGMFGAVWAQAETRKVLSALGGRVVEAELPVARAQDLHRDGRLELPPEQYEQLDEL